MFVLWFIYLPKLITAIFFALVLSASLFRSELIEYLSPYVLLLGLLGGMLFVWWTFQKIRCPKCGTPGWMTMVKKNQPAMVCSACGIVYAKHAVWSFQILVEPHEPDDDELKSVHEESPS